MDNLDLDLDLDLDLNFEGMDLGLGDSNITTQTDSNEGLNSDIESFINEPKKKEDTKQIDTPTEQISLLGSTQPKEEDDTKEEDTKKKAKSKKSRAKKKIKKTEDETEDETEDKTEDSEGGNNSSNQVTPVKLNTKLNPEEIPLPNDMVVVIYGSEQFITTDEVNTLKLVRQKLIDIGYSEFEDKQTIKFKIIDDKIKEDIIFNNKG